MDAARERGVHVGRPSTADPESMRRAAELRDQGLSLAEIAAKLNEEQVPTPSGRGQWGKSSVQWVLHRWNSEHQPE